MSTHFDLVEFELSGERYALDIYLAREIVEMMPITPIPRAPPYISGIINLRGEITSIISLNHLLSLPPNEELENRKIIVLTTETAGGSNVGIIVDDVHSVIQVSEENVEHVGEGISSDISSFVKGIIKVGGDDAEKKQGLVIWVDMLRLLKDLENRTQ